MNKELEYVKCIICNKDNTSIVYKGNLVSDSKLEKELEFACTNTFFGRHSDIVKCKHCGLVYVNPREKNIIESYKDVIDPVYIKEEIGRRLTFKNSLKEIERFKSKGKVLDVGCYCGFFLAVAQEQGWQSYGVEPCIWASEYAREKMGLNVLMGVLGEVEFNDKFFDLVTMWDFLEHIEDPIKELSLSRQLLKDDGLLVLTTINIDSFIAKIMGKKWPQLMRMHTYYYSPSSISKLLAKCGFKVFKIKSHKRIVRWSYFISKIEPINVILFKMLDWFLHFFGLDKKMVGIDFGDIMTVYAKKA